MKIALSNQELLFSIFYVLSFAVTFVLVLVFTSRRKIPLRSVLIMLTTVSLLAIIGSRFFTIPFTEWGRVLATGSINDYPDRSAVGGILFGLAGLLLSQRLLGIGKPILDLYGWIGPIGFWDSENRLLF